MSGELGRPVSTRYRSRMLPRRAWQRSLLVETRFLPHYRSLFTTSFTQNTPVGVNSATKTGLITLLPVATPFWTTAGGALPIDSTVAVPTFNNSTVVLRGGRSEVTIGDPGNDAVKVKIYLLYVRPGADVTPFNALTSVPAMWDPSHYTDFYQSFKIITQQEIICLPGSKPYSMFRSFPPQKIDYDKYRNGEGHLAYCFTIQQLTDIDVAIQPMIFTVSHSVSFCADTT